MASNNDTMIYDVDTDSICQPDPTGDAELDALKNQQSVLLRRLNSQHDEPPSSSSAANGTEESACEPSIETIYMPGLQPFSAGRNHLPSSWSECTLSQDVPLCQVTLSQRSWEFQGILAEFKTVGDASNELKVRKIERVENRELWEKFEFEKKQMKKNQNEVNEVYLYHGTVADKEQICHEGLDQRLSRIGYFGRGIYFCNDPRKCMSYTESAGRQCTVYKCRVLLGNVKVYPAGQCAKELKREPLLEEPQPGGRKYYDSVKGCVSDYDEYVIYKSERVLPEYIITCCSPLVFSIAEQPTSPQQQAAAAAPTSQTGSPTIEEDEESLELRREIPSENSEQDKEVSVELAAGSLGLAKQNEHSPNEHSPNGTERDSARTLDVDEDVHPEVKDLPPQLTVVDSKGERNSARLGQDLKQDTALTVDGNPEGQLGTNDPDHRSQGNETATEATTSACLEGATGDKANMKPNGFQVRYPPDEADHSFDEYAPNERDRHIAVEHLPNVLRVRERIRQEKRKLGNQPQQMPPIAPMLHFQVKAPPNWSQEDYDEHLELIRKIREKVKADKADKMHSMLEQEEEQEKEQEEECESSDEECESSDEESSDMKELLDSLIVQFMDFTACDDIEEARDYVRDAQLDMNKAIINYLNG